MSSQFVRCKSVFKKYTIPKNLLPSPASGMEKCKETLYANHIN